jgi:hypothetical protein
MTKRKICDLPIWYVLRATKKSKAQGNPANMYLNIKQLGNFNWDKTLKETNFGQMLIMVNS